MDAIRAVHLGVGAIPIPPGDVAASGEEYIYLLTHHLGRLGCQVQVIDIRGGVYQKAKRQASTARYYEAWHISLPFRNKFPFWAPFFSFTLITLSLSFFACSSAVVLNRLLSKEKIQVIHAHTREVAFVAALVNKFRGKPAVTVYTPRNGYKLEKQSRRQKLIRISEILALKWTDHIIAMTPSVRNWLIAEFNLDPAKITQIYAGADLDEVEQFLSHKSGNCHQSNIVLCTGVVQRRKNQFTAVKAIAQIIKAHPETKLIFTGRIVEPEYLHEIQKYIDENNLSANVEFKGEVSKQELFNLYCDATLFVFPTTGEIDPVSLKEALAFGLPVVSSTIKPIADVVNDKGCAILFDPDDVDGIAAAINRVLDDNTLRQSMSDRAKELARTFSYESIAAQTLDLYQKLVQSKKQSSR